jgi:hypothetical protein
MAFIWPPPELALAPQQPTPEETLAAMGEPLPPPDAVSGDVPPPPVPAEQLPPAAPPAPAELYSRPEFVPSLEGESSAVISATPVDERVIPFQEQVEYLPPQDQDQTIDALGWQRGGEVLSQLSPEQQAAHATRDEQERAIVEQDARQARIDEAEAAYQDRVVIAREKIARAEKIMADIEAKAASVQTEIDPENWWESRTTGQKVAAYIGAALGGWNAVTRGDGINRELEGFNAAIEQDIASQKATINNQFRAIEGQRGIVNQLHAQGMDLESAAHVARIAAWRMAETTTAQEMSRYDQSGTMARSYAQKLAGIRAQRATAEAKAREETSERANRAADMALKYRADDRAERRFQWEMSKGKGGGGTGVPGVATAAGYDRGGDPVASVLAGWGEDLHDSKHSILDKNRLRELVVKIGNEYGLIPIGSHTESAKVREQLYSARDAVQLANSIRALVHKHGYEPSTGRIQSAAAAQMLSEYSALVGTAKGPEQLALGVLTGPDLGIVKGWIGLDPTDVNWGNELESLETFAKRVTTRANNRLEDLGVAKSQAHAARGEYMKFDVPIPKYGNARAPALNDMISKAEAILENGTPEELTAAGAELVTVLGKRNTNAAERRRIGELGAAIRTQVPEQQRRAYRGGGKGSLGVPYDIGVALQEIATGGSVRDEKAEDVQDDRDYLRWAQQRRREGKSAARIIYDREKGKAVPRPPQKRRGEAEVLLNDEKSAPRESSKWQYQPGLVPSDRKLKENVRSYEAKLADQNDAFKRTWQTIENMGQRGLIAPEALEELRGQVMTEHNEKLPEQEKRRQTRAARGDTAKDLGDPELEGIGLGYGGRPTYGPTNHVERSGLPARTMVEDYPRPLPGIVGDGPTMRERMSPELREVAPHVDEETMREAEAWAENEETLREAEKWAENEATLREAEAWAWRNEIRPEERTERDPTRPTVVEQGPSPRHRPVGAFVEDGGVLTRPLEEVVPDVRPLREPREPHRLSEVLVEPTIRPQTWPSGFEQMGGTPSDERLKDAKEMLNAAPPYSYNYTPESGLDPDVRHNGLMAQDLEQSKMGKQMVEDTPDGKMVNYGGSELAAAVSALNQEIEALKKATGLGDIEEQLTNATRNRTRP